MAGHPGRDIFLWVLAEPWMEETGELWQMGSFELRSYEQEDMILKFRADHAADNNEGYIAVDDVYFFIEESCPHLPAHAVPVPAESE